MRKALPRHKAERAVQEWGSINEAAAQLGVSRWTIRRALTRGQETVSSDIETVEELIARREKLFLAKKNAVDANYEHVVSLPSMLPVGILHMGDPHVDDSGCDWPLLRKHIELVKKTEGLYAANVGDLANNWVGRLSKLYAHQETTSRDAWRLVEWLMQQVRWLYLVRGNHDYWSGDGDPLDWIARGQVEVDAAYDARVRLRFPRGAEVKIWARHDFPGRSMWAKSHGQARAAQLGGYPADILISGHRHCWEHRTAERPDGSVYHAIQVGAYKVIDAYADQLGHAQSRYGSACLTVIDPLSPPPGRVMVFWDAAAGARYLTHLRSTR